MSVCVVQLARSLGLTLLPVHVFLSVSTHAYDILCSLSTLLYQLVDESIYASFSWYSYIFCVAVRRLYDVITQSHGPRQGASRSHYERGVQRCGLVDV